MLPKGNAGNLKAPVTVRQPPSNGIAFNAHQSAGEGLTGDRILHGAMHDRAADVGDCRRRSDRLGGCVCGLIGRGILGRLFLSSGEYPGACDGKHGQSGHSQ